MNDYSVKIKEYEKTESTRYKILTLSDTGMNTIVEINGYKICKFTMVDSNATEISECTIYKSEYDTEPFLLHIIEGNDIYFISYEDTHFEHMVQYLEEYTGSTYYSKIIGNLCANYLKFDTLDYFYQSSSDEKIRINRLSYQDVAESNLARSRANHGRIKEWEDYEE